MEELRMISADGIIHANGFPTESLDKGMEHDPHVIGVDAGSTDAGPSYLGDGTNMHASREAIKDLYRKLLTRAKAQGIPLLIGSAATAGGNVHVDWTAQIFRELASEEGLEVDIATVYTEQKREELESYHSQGRIKALDKAPDFRESMISDAQRIVAMMGPEAYIEALSEDPDVVIGGRSSDVAIFKALAVKKGFPEGLATHLAKVIECGGMIALPRDSGDCILGTLTESEFTVQPTNPEKKTDPLTVASHLLYETANPYEFVEPRGILDTRNCEYSKVDERTVAVGGSEFYPSQQYTVKLEGAKRIGYRALTVFGIRDPTVIDHLDDLIRRSKNLMDQQSEKFGLNPDEYQAFFRVYGRDGVMGELEPETSDPHELGILIEVVAPTQEAAERLIANGRVGMLHSDFPGRKCTSGNVAFPLSPTDISGGATYEFNIWHTLALDNPLAPFEISYERMEA